MQEIVFYQTETGKIPVQDWLDGLDITYIRRIRSRLRRVEKDNFGDYRSVGDGVAELRFSFGNGIRLYYAKDGQRMVILLYGGDKGTQARDIQKAKTLWSDYQQRNNIIRKDKA